MAVPAEDPERNLQGDIANRLGLRQSGLHKVIGANDAGNRAYGADNAQSRKHDGRAHQLMSPNVTWARFFFRWIMHSYRRFRSNTAVSPGGLAPY